MVAKKTEFLQKNDFVFSLLKLWYSQNIKNKILINLQLIFHVIKFSKYTHICKKNFHCRSKERKNILKGIGPQRDLYFFKNYLSISFLNMSMFPVRCFHQRTYVAQSHVNGILNETQTHSCLLVEYFSGFACVYIEVIPRFPFLRVCLFFCFYPKLLFDI